MAVKPIINQREIKWNKVYGFDVAYWIHGGQVHDVVGSWIDDFAFGYDPREGDFLWMLRQVLRDGDIFCDIGANIGLTTLAALRKIGKNGFVYAIEPDPRNQLLLSLTCQRNNLVNRMNILPFAVSNKLGKCKFKLAKQTNVSKIDSEGIDVDTITLSAMKWYRGIPSTFKMDVEGSEVEIIEGALDLFKQDRKFNVLIKVHPSTYSPEHDFEKQLRNLLDIGFKFVYVCSAGYFKPKIFDDLGYEPMLIFQDGNYTRGIYDDIDEDHALYYSTHTVRSYIPDVEEYTNKIVRSILLSKG